MTTETYDGPWSTKNYQPNEKALPYRCPNCVTTGEPICPHRASNLPPVGAPPIVNRERTNGFLGDLT